jgi:hypothetical protein
MNIKKIKSFIKDFKRSFCSSLLFAAFVWVCNFYWSDILLFHDNFRYLLWNSKNY